MSRNVIPRVRGHALKVEGAAFVDGRYLHGAIGPGRCSCGLSSQGDLTSDRQRQHWHRLHKLSVLDQQNFGNNGGPIE